MAQNQATFTLNGETHKLNTATTAATLGNIFNLEEDSINLIDSDGEFIEQENGKFPKLVAGKTYEILGDPEITKIVAKKPKFTKDEIRTLNNELAIQTKDMETTLDGLAQAPKAVSIIKTLTIFAACVNDCSLENEKTVNLIKLLKTPGSFKGSLVQLINETINAFVFADSTTSKIKMKLSAIPDALLSSIKAASTPEDPGAISILKINEKRITSTANFCADEAEKVAELFKGVSDLVVELVQAASSTQGLNKEQVRSIEKAIEEMKIKKEHLIAENEKKEREIAEQEKKTEEARKEYKEKAAKMGDMGNIFTAITGDLLNHGLRETFGMVKDTSKSSGSRDQTLSNSSTQTCMEKRLLEFLERLLKDGIPDEKLEKEKMKKTCLEQKEFFKEFLNYKPKSEMGKHLHAVAQSYCEQLDSASTSEGYAKLKAQFQLIKIAVQTARKEEDEKLHQESKLLKATVGIMEQVNNAAMTAQSTYRADQEREDGLKKEAADFRKEMSDLAAKLGTTDAEKLELQSVIKYLTNKLRDLDNLQVVWLELSKFYRAVTNTVSGPLNDTLREFIEYQNSAIETPQSDNIIKKNLVSAIKSCAICFQVIKCSEISQEISANYVLPRISKANANLQLTKGDAEMKLSETETEFIEMENKLKKLIRNRKKDILQLTEDKIGYYTKQIAITEN